jgi:hypothetical protein
MVPSVTSRNLLTEKLLTLVLKALVILVMTGQKSKMTRQTLRLTSPRQHQHPRRTRLRILANL